ncbi:MAG: cytidylate kinase-like family protein [Bacteroidales bacterium]|nr:cytidylate kinase-like family protein [Bacteroidales bacterium]
MESKFYITIGRQLGAGGLEIAKKLSGIFGIPVYDKELIKIASKESGISPEFFENADENPKRGGGGLFGISFSNMAYNNFGTAHSVLDESELFRIQGEIIRDLASKGPAIFVGRCADYILREEPNCMSVFITASDNDRVERLRKSVKMNGFKEMSDEQLVEYMHKEDRKRADYYNYYTYKEWGHSSSYHLCLNSSFYGAEKCAGIIAEHVTSTLISL